MLDAALDGDNNLIYAWGKRQKAAPSKPYPGLKVSDFQKQLEAQKVDLSVLLVKLSWDGVYNHFLLLLFSFPSVASLLSIRFFFLPFLLAPIPYFFLTIPGSVTFFSHEEKVGVSYNGQFSDLFINLDGYGNVWWCYGGLLYKFTRDGQRSLNTFLYGCGHFVLYVLTIPPQNETTMSGLPVYGLCLSVFLSVRLCLRHSDAHCRCALLQLAALCRPRQLRTYFRGGRRQQRTLHRRRLVYVSF